MNKNVASWLHGLFAALIGGGAGAVTNAVVLPAISPTAYNFSNQLFPLFKVMAATFVINGLLSAFLYLKQSPLPAETLEISATQTTTVTATPSQK